MPNGRSFYRPRALYPCTGHAPATEPPEKNLIAVTVSKRPTLADTR